MIMAAVTAQPRPAGETCAGVARLRPSGPLTAATSLGLRAEVRAAVDQTGGTLVLRTNSVVRRALKDTGTITTFTLWNGPGI